MSAPDYAHTGRDYKNQKNVFNPTRLIYRKSRERVREKSIAYFIFQAPQIGLNWNLINIAIDKILTGQIVYSSVHLLLFKIGFCFQMQYCIYHIRYAELAHSKNAIQKKYPWQIESQKCNSRNGTNKTKFTNRENILQQNFSIGYGNR